MCFDADLLKWSKMVEITIVTTDRDAWYAYQTHPKLVAKEGKIKVWNIAVHQKGETSPYHYKTWLL